MAHHHRSSCRKCGRPKAIAGPISATGQCADCAEEAYLANHRELKQHAGPHFDHWRRRCLAAFGITTADEVRSPGDA